MRALAAGALGAALLGTLALAGPLLAEPALAVSALGSLAGSSSGNLAGPASDLVLTAVRRAASFNGATVGAGGAYSCRIQRGRAYCWGDNSYGQLGNGTRTNSAVPVPVDTTGVLAGKTLRMITTGSATTCVLDKLGQAYCWGYGGTGGLGDGSTVFASDVPVAVQTTGALAGRTLTRITTGYDHTCALDSTGRAYCWGTNSSGELGTGTGTGTFSSVPLPVDTSGALAGKALTRITAAFRQTCALDKAGRAYCWGLNDEGQLGDGSTTNSAVPVRVVTSGVLRGKTLTQVTSGASNACALDSHGRAYCWGNNYEGALGSGSTIANSTVPVRVVTSGVLRGKTLAQISTGVVHSCTLDTNGAAYCWGQGYAGQLGNSGLNSSSVPVLAGPGAPTHVKAKRGHGTGSGVMVSWKAPASLGGATLVGYSATAMPGGAMCATRTATRCTITGLAKGVTYRITAITRTSSGNSGTSAPVTITPGHGHHHGHH